MRKVILLSCTLFVFGISAAAQAPAPPVRTTPNWLKKLGGNDNGMKSYVFVILRTGPNDGNYKGKERDEMFAGPMANIGRLAGEGKLILVGPFDKNEWAYRGIFIFNVATVDEAKKLVETDPTIKGGILVADVVPW